MLGSGAMTNSIEDVTRKAEVIMLVGSNPEEAHPVIGMQIRAAVERGCRLIVVDPRDIGLAAHADIHLKLRPGTNVAFANGIVNYLIQHELYDEDFVRERTEGFEILAATVRDYTPELVEDICGIDRRDLVAAAKMYAAADAAAIMYCLGVTEHSTGTDGVMALSNIAMISGNLGKPGGGVNPLRGQNNVQGACDMGVLPNLFPGYQEVTDPAVRAKFAAAWGIDPALMDDQVGTRITEVPHKALTGEIKAYYIMGEDPLQTEADLGLVRKGIEALDFVVVQDIFMTKTAEIADVLLPATSWGEHGGVFTCADRGFQRFEQAIPPAGNVKRDWEIISLLASEMGYPMHYENNQQIWDEMRELCPLFYGVTWEKMGDMGHVQWPCPTLDHPGTPWLYKDNRFDTPSGKGQLFATAWRAPAERPDDEWPLVLCTVREVGHYSCRSMTGNCAALQSLADEPGRVQMNPVDAQRLGIADKQLVWVSSRRGKVITRADLSDRINPGAVYMTYQWWVGACNELTQDNLDPISKTPETKYCAVKVEAIADQQWAERYAWTAYSDMKARLKAAADV